MNKNENIFHLVFVTKYRKKILSKDIINFIEEIILYTAEKHQFEIIEIGSENADHIHLAVKLKPNQSVSFIVKLLKQYTRYYMWKNYAPILRKFYWYNNFLWSSGYYCATIGNVSKEKVLKYIENQN